MPAVSSSPILTVVDDSDPLLGELAEVPPAPDGLLELLAQVADPRKPRGIRHGLTGVLAMALSAVITGAQSFVAIAEWAADASPEALARLGVTGTAPSESTIRRCLQRLAPDQLDHLIGAWMWLRTSTIGGRRVIAFDGKTLRGARDAAGNLMHLLAGLCQHTGAVLAQHRGRREDQRNRRPADASSHDSRHRRGASAADACCSCPARHRRSTCTGRRCRTTSSP